MKRAIIIMIVSIHIAAAAAFTAANSDTDGGFDLSWNTVDGGGGESSGGAFTLAGTIGQADAPGSGAPLTGGGFEVIGGFWAGGGPAIPCPADITGDGQINVSDLLAVISAWGVCPGCPADINADGQVNVTDLLMVINGWGACAP